MEKWDGTVLNINETCNNLGEKSLQILHIVCMPCLAATQLPIPVAKERVLLSMLFQKQIYQSLTLFWDI